MPPDPNDLTMEDLLAAWDLLRDEMCMAAAMHEEASNIDMRREAAGTALEALADFWM